MSLGHVENSITCAVGGSSHDDEEAVVTDLLGDPICVLKIPTLG